MSPKKTVPERSREKSAALDWIEQHSRRIIEISDWIWGHPELGFREIETSRLLASEVEKHGFRVAKEAAAMPTAFVASWGEGPPVIALLGELDALAGLSQKAVPWEEPVERGAPGHGCGHNIHAASALAGAVAMKTAMEESGLPGTVRFYGCPAEETLDGKVWMVRDGLFDGVDASLSHHPYTVNTASLASSNAVNSVRFHFHGKSSHAAVSPQHGISALDAVELMNVGVNFLREHVIEKARIHYVVEEGGGQPNVVPEYARSWHYIRAPEREQVEEIYRRVLAIAQGADLMTGATHEVEFLTGCSNKLPNKVLSELVAANMREVGAPVHSREEIDFASKLAETFSRGAKREALVDSGRPDGESLMGEHFDERILDAWDDGKQSAGSTDVSDVSWVTPTMEFSTACCALGTTVHSWQFTAQTGMSIGHKSLVFAAKVLALSGLDLICRPGLLEEARKEWEKRLGGRTYRSPIPEGVNPPIPL